MVTQVKAAPGHRRYDWNLIQQERNAGMSVKDICAKFGCSDVSVYHRTVTPGKTKPAGSRHAELERIKGVNWTAVQNDRTDNVLPNKEIAKKYNISTSSMYKYTKSPKRTGSAISKPIRKTGSGIYPRKPKAPKVILATMNGTANARELARQALVVALDEREKLNGLIEKLEAINS